MSLPYELVTFMRIKDAKAARSVYFHGRVRELGVNGIRMINIDGPEREKLENVLFEEEVNRLKENEELLPVSFVELVQDPITKETSLTVRSRELKYTPGTSDRDDGLYYLVGTTDLQFSTSNMMRTDSLVLLWSFRVENFDGSMNLWFAALYENI